jgi:glycerophosphoryl diester phosphodiesterase
MPLLDEVIALTPPGKRLFVELKTGPEIVPELVRCMARTGANTETITFISFHYETLKEVRRQLPSYPTQYVVSYTVRESSPPDEHRRRLDKIIGEARAAGLTGLDLKSTWPLTVDDVGKIREAGLELHVWTVDDPALAQHWIKLGAQSLTTNRPGWLREQLKL